MLIVVPGQWFQCDIVRGVQTDRLLTEGFTRVFSKYYWVGTNETSRLRGGPIQR